MAPKKSELSLEYPGSSHVNGGMRKWISRGSVEALPTLQRYARSLVGATDADDLVQETLVRAYDAADRFRAGQNLKSWLLAILHNLFVSGWRREQTASRGAHELAVLNPSTVAPAQEHAAQLRQVTETFQTLPAEQRSVLHLVVVEGLSYQETAQVLGVPIGTVMSRLSRARAALRRAPQTTRPGFRVINGGERDG